MNGLGFLAMAKGLLVDYGVPYFAGVATMGAIWVLWWVFQPPKPPAPMRGEWRDNGYHPTYTGH